MTMTTQTCRRCQCPFVYARTFRTDFDLIRLKHYVAGVRVLDVDGPTYRSLVTAVEAMNHLDLCHLASQRIDFVSAIARQTINTRFAFNPSKEITQ